MLKHISTKKKSLIILVFTLIIIFSLFSCGKKPVEKTGRFSFSLITTDALIFNGDEEILVDTNNNYESITKVVSKDNGYVIFGISDSCSFTLGNNSEVDISTDEDSVTLELVKGELLYDNRVEDNITINFNEYSLPLSVSSGYIYCDESVSNFTCLLDSAKINDTSLDYSKSLNDNNMTDSVSALINKYLEFDIQYADKLTAVGWYVDQKGLWEFNEGVEETTDTIKGNENLPDMVVTIADTLKIYNKQIQYPKVKTSVTDKTVIYYKTEGGKWEKNVPGFKDAGAYTIYVKVENPKYETYETSFTFTIEKAYQIVNVLDTEVTFDKDYHGVKVECSEIEGTTISYKNPNTGSWSNDVPKYSNVGSYPVSIKVENPNYYEYAIDAHLLIKKADFKVNVDNINLVYDGKTHSSPISVNDMEGTTIYYRSKPTDSWGKTELSYVNSGDYTVYFKVENSNYNTVEKSYLITINKANMSVSANDINLEYDKAEHKVVLNTSETSGVEVQYKVGDGSWTKNVPSFTNVTNTVVHIKATKANFNDAETTCNVNIKKGTLTGTISNIDVTYDKGSHYSTLAISDTVGTSIYYRKSESESWSTTNPKFTDAGEYKVYIKAENPNYYTYETSYNINIKKANLTLTATNISTTYDKKNHKSTISVSDTSSTTISYKVGDADWNTTEPTFKNVVSQTVSVKAENKNYNTASTTYSVDIKKATLTLSLTNINTTYDKKEHSSTAKVNDSEGTKIYYKVGEGEWSETVPVFKNVSLETVYVKAENPNYNTIEGSYSVSIGKAKMSFNGKNLSCTYDQNEHSLDIKVIDSQYKTVDEANISYKVGSDGMWSNTAPVFKDVIDTTVYIKAESQNYESIETQKSVVVKKATLNVSTYIYEYYNGKALDVIIDTGNITEGNTFYYRKGTSGSWSETAPSYTKVGTYTGYVRIVNPNCETYEGKYTFYLEESSIGTSASKGKSERINCNVSINGVEYEIGNLYIYDIDNHNAILCEQKSVSKGRTFVQYNYEGPLISSFNPGTYNLIVGLDYVDSKANCHFGKYKLTVSEDGSFTWSSQGSVSNTSTYIKLINKYK